jgi:isopropylmalate/homocitrate/citramalate synthase/4-hydroxybenzoate polyprenyltransferase
VKRALFAHLETWRPYTALYVGLVGLAGAALSAPHAPAGRLVAAWAVPTIGWLAGLYGGDYFDRQLDATAKPHRPIPSGRLAAGTALVIFIVLTVAGAALSLWLNWRTIFLVVLACAIGVAYSTVGKGRGLLGNLLRGSLTALAFWYGSMMVAELPPPRVVPIALVFLLHDTGSNLVGAVRDIEGDRDGGYITFAVRHGALTATRVATGLLASSYVLALAVPRIDSRPVTGSFAAVLLAAAVTAAAGVTPMFSSGDRLVAYRAHTILVFARIMLAGAFLAWLLAGAVAGPIVVAALSLTWVTQCLLRRKHEFAPDHAAPLGPEVVLDYVDAQLRTIGRQAALADWQRVIEIRLTDPDVQVRLEAAAGSVSRLPADGTPPGYPVISIATTGPVFRDIFLLGTTSPRRAYLTRQLSMSASASDMIRLNQLFNAFRGRRSAVTAVDRAEPGTAIEQPEAAAREAAIPPVVVISDTTLRDGEQMPGVLFSPTEKLGIARRLADAGIPLIEAGFPAVSAEEADAVRAIVDQAGDTVIQVIARPVEGDVDAAIATGAPSIAIFIGTSDSHLREKLRMTLDEVIGAVDRAVRRAKRSGRQVVFAAEDATRTDVEALVRVCLAAGEAGADTIGLADTVGIANPESMRRLVSTVGAACPLPIAVHCHNDLGLATANSLAGILAGASGVQCSVLGIGERAGNAPLEQVVLALHASYGHDTGLSLPALAPLAEYVARLIDVPIPPQYPVVGGNAFTHESGLHIDGITHQPSTYEPYRPELVGRARRIVLGKHSGVSAVLAVAKEAGLTLDHEQARAVLMAVKSSAQSKETHPPLDANAMVTRFADLTARSTHS